MARPTENDFPSVTRELQRRLNVRVPYSYEQGQNRMRAEVSSMLGCSSTRARHIFAKLVEGGYVRFGKHPYFIEGNVGSWSYHPKPRSRQT